MAGLDLSPPLLCSSIEEGAGIRGEGDGNQGEVLGILGEGLERNLGGNLEGNLEEGHPGAYRDGNREEGPYRDGSQEAVPYRAYREVAPCPLGGILVGGCLVGAYRLGAYHDHMPLAVPPRLVRGATSFLGQVRQHRELVQSILGQLQGQRAYHGQQVLQFLIRRSTVKDATSGPHRLVGEVHQRSC